MAPRVTKRTASGPGSKRAMRGRVAAASEAANVTEKVKAEEKKISVAVAENETDPSVVMYVKETKTPVAIQDKEVEAEVKDGLNINEEIDDGSIRKDTCAKVSIDDYERDECLDLEDNEHEFESEEYGGVDYDHKEIEQDLQEDEDEDEGQAEEDPEEVEVSDEEGDLVEEVEGVTEELEAEEDGHVREDHAEMYDAADEEHHEVVKERRKRKEFEIFVGGLDKDATESDLRKVFSEVGEITEVRLMMNTQTKKNKGFAFLCFASVEQARRACSQLRNPVVNGKQCGVSPVQDSDTLFVGNICKTWTKETLKDKLKHYAVEDLEDLTLVEDGNNAGLNRGFAFLEFLSRADATRAFRRLQKRDVVFGVDRPAKVSFADSFVDPDDEIMAQVKTVFVDGISASWDEEHVKHLLKKYGEIEKIELARDMPSARRKDFGFITFDTHDSAVICAKSITNEELGGEDNKAKVRARLSRPLQRGKGRSVTGGNLRSGRGLVRGARNSWGGPVHRIVSIHGSRGPGSRIPPVADHGYRRPAGVRDRRPVMTPPRSRPAAPLLRSYDRRPPPVPSYAKSGLKRDYGHREELLHPRSRAALNYSYRQASDRRLHYKDGYPPRAPAYPDYPRGDTSRSAARRPYIDDGYSERYESPPPTYRDSRGREYDSMSGSKRPYAALDDDPLHCSEVGMRDSRARIDYDSGSGTSHYGDTYCDRFERPSIGYGGSRGSLLSQESHGFYSGRQRMDDNGGPYGGTDVSGVYSSSSGSGYMSRGSNVDSSSYSSLYPGWGLGGNSYIGSSGSRSYY